MRSTTKAELREVAVRGDGVVLVDRFGRSDDRTSTLHRLGCRWLSAASASTPLLYETSFGAAFKWLERNRGPEGIAWKQCGACKGNRARPGARPQPRSEPASAR